MVVIGAEGQHDDELPCWVGRLMTRDEHRGLKVHIYGTTGTKAEDAHKCWRRGYLTSDNYSYFAERRSEPDHTVLTNHTGEVRFDDENVIVGGFHLTHRDTLPAWVLRAMSTSKMTAWKHNDNHNARDEL
jgi:hypothetical protein